MQPDRGGETHNIICNSTVIGPVVQARDIGGVSGSPAWSEGWAKRAFGSSLWEHVEQQTDLYRSHVCAAAAHLESVVTALLPQLADDPWLEAGFATRFLDRIEWLWSEEAPQLCASEAALLVLLPFLRQANLIRLAVEHTELNPAQLGRGAQDTANFRSFEAFLDGHDVLVHRAGLRPGSAPPIGWWLFHRWLARHESLVDPDRIGQLLRNVGRALEELGETFAVERVCSLLEGLRLGPDVCHPEFLGVLPSEDRVRAPGQQRVRYQRLALTGALAGILAFEATALPDVVGEHLGIPVPVDPATVLSCLDEAVWGGPHDLPVLRARCPHEAVVEGLREHAANADELLHGVRRLVAERITQPMPTLPTRLSADGVGPVSGTFDSWARFRLDQHRMRDLLMGVQLYKDPDLAVRELYQNALDACRYRAARIEYLDRTQAASYSYTGTVSFEQGIEDGRAYLECRDNGIGMGESELRGVFSKAGGRFPGQAEFRHERTAWEELDPPIQFHPNSRFGIGVFSYFMLADEIRVITCRMGLDGTPGPTLEVGIHGPAHLFRIVQVAERGDEPGTRIRLYLSSDRPWSCVEVLQRLLAVAEFETSARSGGEAVTWRPAELQSRTGPVSEGFGLQASGNIVEWRGAPDGCQVFWCETGGALLVDGLIVHPSRRRGVCAGRGPTVYGAVVNLVGSRAPARISVDRTEILEDVSEFVEGLLVAAAAELAASEDDLMSYAWICRVAEQSPVIADILTEACISERRELSFGGRQVDIAWTGCLPADQSLLQEVGIHRRDRASLSEGWISGDVPDEILLWRLLAHRPNSTLDELAGFYPELSTFDDLKPAMPSDQLLLASIRDDSMKYGHWRGNNVAIATVIDDVVAMLGCAASDAENWALRFRAGLSAQATSGPPGQESSLSRGVSDVDEVWFHDKVYGEFLVPPGPVPYRHIFELAENRSLRVNEVVERLRQFGFDVSFQLSDPPTKQEKRFFCSAEWWYFNTDEAMPFAYLLIAAHRLHEPLSELEEIACSRGIKISCTGFPKGLTFERALHLLRWNDYEDDYLEKDSPLALELLIKRARENRVSIAQVVDWLRKLGMPVPDLGNTLRAALARVPTRSERHRYSSPGRLGVSRGQDPQP